MTTKEKERCEVDFTTDRDKMLNINTRQSNRRLSFNSQTKKTINFDKIKETKFKLDDIVNTNISKFKTAKANYGKTYKKGLFFGTSRTCDEYIRLSTSTSDSDKKIAAEHSNIITNCKGFLETMKTSNTDALKGLLKLFSEKANRQLIRIVRNPKENRVQRMACYLKILTETSKIVGCQSNYRSSYSSSSVDDIISKITEKYKKTPDVLIYSELAQAYIKFLLFNRTNAQLVLKSLQSIDTKFATSLKEIIDEYGTCNTSTTSRG